MGFQLLILDRNSSFHDDSKHFSYFFKSKNTLPFYLLCFEKNLRPLKKKNLYHNIIKKSEEIRIFHYRIDYIKKVFIYTNQKYFSKSSCPFSLPSLPFLSSVFSWHHYSLGSPLFLSFDIVYFPLLFFFACTGSLLLHRLFSSYREQGLLLSWVWGLLIVVASLVAEHRF